MVTDSDGNAEASATGDRAVVVDELRRHGIDPDDWMGVYDELGEAEAAEGVPPAASAAGLGDDEVSVSVAEMADELADDYDPYDPADNPSVDRGPLPGTEHHQSLR